MTLKAVSIVTTMVLAGLSFPVKAQPPCAEVIRLRNGATDAWRQAMGAPRPEQCAAFDRASSAAEETLSYATSSRQSCNISDRMLSDIEGYHREAVRARMNACAGRPIQPYPADIIHR